MFNAERIQSLLQIRMPHYPLPREFYLEQETFHADLELIFHREWIFAGHTFELDRPGSYLTLDVGLYPIVVVRGTDGAIRAFHNVCRHRGSRVCGQRRGVAARMVCPYHHWTYDLDGRLLFAREMGDSFRPELHGLKPVACETVGGFIFVSVAETPRNFSKFRQHAEPYLEPHELDNARVVHETTIIEEANWKIVFENNRECYHCAGNHPELMRSFVENRTVAGLDATEQDTELTEHWARCGRDGIESALRIDRDGFYRMTRVPLKRGTVSYTLSGEVAVSRPLGRCGNRNPGVLLLFHYPSTWNHILADHAVTFRLLPLGPNRSELTTKWIVHKDAVEGRDYVLEDLVRVWSMTNEQDRRLVQEVAKGVASPAYEPGPFSELAEAGPNQFVDWYCNLLARRLEESR